MVNRSDNTVLNRMNRDRINDRGLDPIAIERRCWLLVGCLGVPLLVQLSGEQGGLYAEMLHAKLLYKLGKSLRLKSYV